MAALVGRDGRVCGIDISEDVARVSARIGSNPLYLSKSDKVVTVLHHLAHAYSAFAACPFNEGVVMVVDGVGNYNSDVTEPGQLTDNVNPLARESESYYKFDGSRIETLKKIWLRPVRGFLSDEFYFMPGLGARTRVPIFQRPVLMGPRFRACEEMSTASVVLSSVAEVGNDPAGTQKPRSNLSHGFGESRLFSSTPRELSCKSNRLPPANN
jgi:hypothetical protein